MNNKNGNFGVIFPISSFAIFFWIAIIIIIIFICIGLHTGIFIIASIIPNLEDMFLNNVFPTWEYANFWLELFFVFLWLFMLYLMISAIGDKIFEKKVWKCLVEGNEIEKERLLLYKQKFKTVKSNLVVFSIILILIYTGKNKLDTSLWYSKAIKAYNKQDYEMALKYIEFAQNLNSSDDYTMANKLESFEEKINNKLTQEK